MSNQSEGPSDAELAASVPPSAGANEIRVGSFVLVGFLAFMLALFLMTDPATFRGRYIVSTVVQDAGGVRRGDPVQMKGVNIGRVHRFRIEGDGVIITLEIEGEWEIPSDSRTQLSANGLLGGQVVEIVRGTSAQALSAGAVIPGGGGADLFATVDSIGGAAISVMDRIELLLSDGTVASVEGSASELQTLLAGLSELTRTQGAEIARLTSSLNGSAAILEGALEGPEVARALANADSALIRLNETGEALKSVTASLDSILARVARGEGSLGKLTTDDRLYENLVAASESLRALTTDLREHPGRYIKISVF